MTSKKNFTNQIWNLDCRDAMPYFEDGCVNAIVTDIPFGLGFTGRADNYNRKSRNVIGKYVDVEPRKYPEFCKTWVGMAKRLLSDDGSMFIFSGWTNLHHVLNALDYYNLLPLVNHIIWKYPFGVVTKRRFVSSHYHCLYVCKDDKKRQFFRNCRFKDGKLRYADMEDVWNIKKEYWQGRMKTPNKMPEEIIRKILAYSTKKGDLVLDPFLGSGQTALIAGKMGRRFLGFEIVEKYHRFATKRLIKEKLLVVPKI